MDAEERKMAASDRAVRSTEDKQFLHTECASLGELRAVRVDRGDTSSLQDTVLGIWSLAITVS